MAGIAGRASRDRGLARTPRAVAGAPQSGRRDDACDENRIVPLPSAMLLPVVEPITERAFCIYDELVRSCASASCAVA